ncbi:MAG: hypothetical protein FWF01_04840 [Alphaproteobacteria bacterium]|nr:hypothetical protein [Alphaproteobacteria bacterium]
MSSISSKNKVSFNSSPSLQRFNRVKSDAGTDPDPVSPAEGAAAVTAYESLDPDDRGRQKKQQQQPQPKQELEDQAPQELSGLLAAQEQSEKQAPVAGKNAYSATNQTPPPNRKLADA